MRALVLVKTIMRDFSMAKIESYDSSLINFANIHLYGPDNPYSWEGCKASNDLLMRKMETVIFERVLSSRFKENSGLIYDITSGVLDRLKYRFLDRLCRK